MAASNPLGFGADFGQLWVGASYQPRARRSDGHTGAAAVGFGLGDAERYLGLQVGVNSFSTVSSGFWRRSAVDLHLHRALPGGFGVAVGWESAYTWGTGEVTKDSGSNRYLAASRWIALRVAQPLSLMAEWTGQDLMLAGSLTPLRNHPLAVTAGITDLTGAAGDGARFVVGVSAGHDFTRR